MDVLSLLQNKNRGLQRFLEFSSDFLTIAERGDLTAINVFTKERDKMISILDLHDRKITDATHLLTHEARTPALTDSIRALLEDEKRLVHSILDIDTQITRCIEKEKNRILLDIVAAERNKDLAGRFKSEWVPASGEGLDRTV